MTTNNGTSARDAMIVKLLKRILYPLARLCLSNGVTFAAAEELLKQAFVHAAKSLQPGLPAHGAVSRISTATGLNRREVSRLIDANGSERPTKPPIASEIFARWTTDPAWRGPDGKPLAIKRQGSHPSFEKLAQSITRDIHPRSMLEELVRLGMARYDEELDSISLAHQDFVPGGDNLQMLELLGGNVGDHLEAAVSNVLTDNRRHHEQAIFADELSLESIEALRPLVAAQWLAIRDALVPRISDLIEADRLAGRAQDQRLRIGVYSFDETTTPPPEKRNSIEEKHHES